MRDDVNLSLSLSLSLSLNRSGRNKSAIPSSRSQKVLSIANNKYRSMGIASSHVSPLIYDTVVLGHYWILSEDAEERKRRQLRRRQPSPNVARKITRTLQTCVSRSAWNFSISSRKRILKRKFVIPRVFWTERERERENKQTEQNNPAKCEISVNNFGGGMIDFFINALFDPNERISPFENALTLIF